MPWTPPQDYYDRFNPTKQYKRHLFLAGKVIQAAEFNEVQSRRQHQFEELANVILADGDVVDGGDVVINAGTGATTVEAGKVYLQGDIHSVPQATFTIVTTGEVNIGVYLTDEVITSAEDPDLVDPSIGMRNYGQPGAQRLKTSGVWGFSGDGQSGVFFPVYRVIDGAVIPKTTPPQIDAITGAIARYDRDSAGGYYIVAGLEVWRAADTDAGEQSYSISAGKAQIGGRSVELGTGRRVNYAPTADLSTVSSEPHVSSGTAQQRIDTNNSPIEAIANVTCTKQKTVTVTHGGFTGAVDDLPDETVLTVVTCEQGGTTYTEGVDFQLVASNMDWSLAGNEPAPGSTYDVTYNYLATVSAESPDETGFSVTGALSGTLINVTYDWKLPRWDRLCLLQDGTTEWIKGISHETDPLSPVVPNNRLMLASVYQSWTATGRKVKNDGLKLTSMSDMSALRHSVSDLYDLIAQERLRNEINANHPVAKKGVLVDSFSNNAQRDLGITQDAIVLPGELTLPITEVGDFPTAANSAPIVLPHSLSISEIQQTARSGAKKINPYMVFDPVPAPVTLTPSRDVHVTTEVKWAPPIILISHLGVDIMKRHFRAEDSAACQQRNSCGVHRRELGLWIGNGGNWRELLQFDTWPVGTELIDVDRRELETIYPRTVTFDIAAFGPNETITKIEFDGVDITTSGV